MKRLRPLSEANRAIVRTITDRLPRKPASPEAVASAEEFRAKVAAGTAIVETTAERRARRGDR